MRANKLGSMILPAALLALVLNFIGTAAFAVTMGEVVGQVSQNTYTDYLNNHLYTKTGNSRGITTPNQHDQAQTDIYTSFSSFGLTTTRDPFIYNSSTYYNVVGVLPGKLHPSQVYIVGAHYDSVNNPGADDNASGVAGVMEAARVLSKYQFESTLVFIGFDREEQGLFGSYAYANTHKNDDIHGMISMDMIAYNPLGSLHDQANVYYANTTPPPIATQLSDAITQYAGGLSSTVARLNSAISDHYPFYFNKFEAALLIERDVWNNPKYHTAADSVDTPNYIDYTYATNMTRGVVGYLATQATIVPEPSTLILLIAGAGTLLAYAWRRRRHTRV